MSIPITNSIPVVAFDKDPIEAEFLSRWERARPVLSRKLVGRMVPQDAEDLLQDCFTRMWNSMERLQFESDAPFVAYAKAVLASLERDRRRGIRPRVLSLDAMGKPDFPSGTELQNQILDFIQLSLLCERADEHWLGPKPDLLEMRLLIAALFLVDGTPTNLTMELANRLLGEGYMMQDHQLFEFIDVPRVVRQIAFCELATHAKSHRALYSKRTCIKETHFDAAKHSHSRCNHIEGPSEQVLGSLGEECTRGTLTQIAQSIWNRSQVLQCRTRALSTDGVWKRLAFQLVPPGMPHEEFVHVIGPAAAACGFEISSNTLRAWISNRRIYSELLNSENPTVRRR